MSFSLLKSLKSPLKLQHATYNYIYNTYMGSFLSRILINLLFLNRELRNCRIKNSLLFSFCVLTDETSLHLFYECKSIKLLWNSYAWHFYDVLVLPLLTSQTALVGISNEFAIDKNKLLKNHILLVFKLHSYSSQKKHVLNINTLLNNVAKVKEVGKKSQVRMRRKLIMSNILYIQRSKI